MIIDNNIDEEEKNVPKKNYKNINNFLIRINSWNQYHLVSRLSPTNRLIFNN